MLISNRWQAGRWPTEARRLAGCCHFLWVVAFLVGYVGGGCASRPFYTARTLPVEFQPRPSPDLREISLAKLTALAGPSDQIVPGDLLEVSILTDVEPKPSPYFCRVDDAGQIGIPAVGTVSVGGLRLTEAEAAIAQAAMARDVYRRPKVTVNRTSARTYRIAVTGAVKEPGVYEIPASQADLMAAIMQAGGLLPEAEPVAEIRLAQKNKLPDLPISQAKNSSEVQPVAFTQDSGDNGDVLRVDLLQASRDPANSVRIRLNDGDAVHIPERKLNPIYVDGLVTRPGAYPFPPNRDVRLLDALAMAGGRSNPLAEKVWVVRQVPGRPEPILIRANFRQAIKNPEENIPIAPGDVIKVEDTVSTSIYGFLRDFFRIGGSVALF